MKTISTIAAAAVVAASIAFAASANAAPTGHGNACSGNICQSPGNVQINNAPPPVRYYPSETCRFCSAATAAFSATCADT